jgi:uncharacterized protein (TIGR03435 family)
MRVFARISFTALLIGSAFSQSTPNPAAFQAADIHPSTLTPQQNQPARGPFLGGGRYEMRGATMLDLVTRAYGIDADKVVGGPTWLEFDHFDILARTPPNTTQETAKAMLQALLADRFKLVLRKEDRPMSAFNLITAKGKPKLREADSSGEPGCKSQIQAPNGPSDTPVSIASIMVNFTCRNMTMEAFANQLRNSGGAAFIGTSPVIDKTDLKGAWDFEYKTSLDIRLPVLGASAEAGISITDALEKQLGLKLDPVKTSQPVIVVESASQPTPNSPDIAKLLPVALTEFDVADVKPSAPAQGPNVPIGLRVQPGGRVNLTGLPMRTLILQAYGITNDMLVGAPKWIDDARFDIIAKAPGEIPVGVLPPNANAAAQPPRDMDTIWVMIRALLADRFKLTTHTEERPATAYNLVAVKPRLKKADPSSRTKFSEGPGPDGKDPRTANPALSRLISFQNITMAQFAEKLTSVGSGYIRSSVLDKTGLDGAYDFTLNFSPPGLVNNGGRGGGTLFISNGNNSQPIQINLGREGGDSSEPNGALSLFDALEKQLGLKLEETKRPVTVVVIDHIEEKPTEN